MEVLSSVFNSETETAKATKQSFPISKMSSTADYTKPVSGISEWLDGGKNSDAHLDHIQMASFLSNYT